MIQTIKEHGYKVRIITREIQHVAKLRGLVDYVSISLDADVLGGIARYRHEWAGFDIEYSLVLPPLPTADIVTLKPQYSALQRQLGQRLVLRENLNSIHSLDFSNLIFGHSGIVFVAKKLCLASRYLKAIVAGDWVEAERKFQPSFSYQPFVRIVAATNSLPYTRTKASLSLRSVIAPPILHALVAWRVSSPACRALHRVARWAAVWNVASDTSHEDANPP
ncbi:hypothetical protein [Janthinobacterium fluminis]|uniref:Uncharacterized protein n=1 Tax=Janthinobacterium fluminis TaxID=2987524 RepID=A0ABT5K6Q4_9BURK|nr:hypothetical protein [Janthinobacterium fluminis]MDC8760685.1 hypothetical protein [Janthinobacterium fluminis]